MPLFESNRKVQTLGSSLALTLPSLFAKVHEIEKGSEVRAIHGPSGVLVVSCVESDEAVIEHLNKLLDLMEESVTEEKSSVE